MNLTCLSFQLSFSLLRSLHLDSSQKQNSCNDVVRGVGNCGLSRNGSHGTRLTIYTIIVNLICVTNRRRTTVFLSHLHSTRRGVEASLGHMTRDGVVSDTPVDEIWARAAAWSSARVERGSSSASRLTPD